MAIETKSAYEKKSWLKFYPEGVPHEIEVPKESLIEAFDQSVERWKGKTALIFYGRKMNYLDLKEQVDRFATALYDLGVRKGDRVAIYLLNCPQYAVAVFGTLRIGAVVTTISPVYVSSEIRHQLKDSGAETIICQDILYDTFKKSGVELKNVITTNIGEYLPPLKKFLGKSMLRSVYKKMEIPPVEILRQEGVHQFQGLIKGYPANPPRITINPEQDLAALPYSGGTTGLPKGVMLTHQNWVAMETTWYSYFGPVLKDGEELFTVYMPIYHVYGLGMLLLGLTRGYTLVLFTNPDLDDILASITNYRATVFFSNPSMYELLKEHEKTDRVAWKRLKILTSGTDALLESTANDWQRRTGVGIHEYYGATETGLTHGTPIGRRKIGSFGVPCPGVRVLVIDPETNEVLPPGEIGEVVVQSPQTTIGYWNNPEENKRAQVEIDGEVWFRSGDLARMDDEGYFWFYDRKRDLIKYKGYSVFAREVEEVLTSHPQIKEAGVVGVPDPKVGEKVKAVVVLQTEARGKVFEEEIIKYCAESLAHYKVPKIVEFRGEVPKTDVGKISRRELREEK